MFYGCIVKILGARSKFLGCGQNSWDVVKIPGVWSNFGVCGYCPCGNSRKVGTYDFDGHSQCHIIMVTEPSSMIKINGDTVAILEGHTS